MNNFSRFTKYSLEKSNYRVIFVYDVLTVLEETRLSVQSFRSISHYGLYTPSPHVWPVINSEKFGLQYLFCVHAFIFNPFYLAFCFFAIFILIGVMRSFALCHLLPCFSQPKSAQCMACEMIPDLILASVPIRFSTSPR